MPSISRPNHTGIQVANIERSLEFYRDVLGFELVFSWNPQAAYLEELVGYPGVDVHAAMLRMPGSDMFLELSEYRNIERHAVDTAGGNPGVVHIGFYVDDLDGLYELLSDKGVASVSRPVTPTIGPNQGGRVVNMLDPDGIRVELVQSKKSFDGLPLDDERRPDLGDRKRRLLGPD